MYSYDETLLWKNKYDTLKKEHEELIKILDSCMESNIQLQQIITVLHTTDFSDNFKLELIKRTIKNGR
jgi:hypothetical protein